MQGLVDRGLGIEGETSIDLSGHLSGDDLEDLLAERDKETVEGGVNLLVESLALLLAVRHGSVDEGGIFGLLGRSQDQRRVGGGILRLVLADSWDMLDRSSPFTQGLMDTYWQRHLEESIVSACSIHIHIRVTRCLPESQTTTCAWDTWSVLRLNPRAKSRSYLQCQWP